jgi:hypothetical protein
VTKEGNTKSGLATPFIKKAKPLGSARQNLIDLDFVEKQGKN